MKKIVLSLAIFTFILTVSALTATGVKASFPSCSNPQGDLKVHYDSGQHGIVGESGTRSGVDDVYFVDSYDQLLQCFCGSEGEGIQTDWLYAGEIDLTQIENYINSGWILVANGADWGLIEGQYLARNSSYICGGQEVTPTPIPTSSPTPTPTETTSRGGNGGQVGAPQCTAERPTAPSILSVDRKGTTAVVSWTKVDKATHYTLSYGISLDNLEYGVPNTGNVTSYTVAALDPNNNYYFKVYAVNDCMPSDPSSERPIGGAQVLGLANTGESSLLYSTTLFGVSSVLLGLTLRGKKRPY